jgi:acyl-homoserine-lactone acylase
VLLGRKLTTLVAALAALPAGAAAAAPGDGGLSATIRYTEYGIPHVVARDYAGLGFGQGYAAARDNACAIAATMLTTSARRSRYLGPDARPVGALSQATTNLASDLYFQGINDSGVVERLVAQPAPHGPAREVRDAVRGYAAGVSRYLRATGSPTRPAGTPRGCGR